MTKQANGVKGMAVVPAGTLPLDAPDLTEGVSLFERLLKDPAVDPEKMERFMAMQERINARAAESEFNAAMTAAQKQMRPVATDSDNPQTRSKYASYEALDRALRPIYTEHNFALSFNTDEAPGPETVRVLCKVTHAGGHAERYRLDMPSDGKGAKGGDVMTKTHATGSAVTYGMRYLLKMIFNVAVGEGDDDGNSAAGKPAPKAPDGFDDWLTDMTATADEGSPALKIAWTASRKDYREYLTAQKPSLWTDLKAKAAKVAA